MPDMHTYENDEIEVTWSKSTCIHAAVCVRRLSSVFDTEKRPWVNVDGASAQEVEDVIERCPSGALQFKRKK